MHQALEVTMSTQVRQILRFVSCNTSDLFPGLYQDVCSDTSATLLSMATYDSNQRGANPIPTSSFRKRKNEDASLAPKRPQHNSQPSGLSELPSGREQTHLSPKVTKSVAPHHCASILPPGRLDSTCGHTATHVEDQDVSGPIPRSQLSPRSTVDAIRGDQDAACDSTQSRTATLIHSHDTSDHSMVNNYDSDVTEYEDNGALEVIERLIQAERASQTIETYSVTESDEEEMAILASSFSLTTQQTPRTSFVDLVDSSSTLGAPESRRSSPNAMLHIHTRALTAKPPAVDENLLDEVVDWDSIVESVTSSPNVGARSGSSVSPNSPNPISNLSHRLSQHPPPPRTISSFTSSATTNTGGTIVRTPFPLPVRAKSPVPGLTNATVLRTCFRIEHLLTEADRCYRSGQDVLFELYARVVSSSRKQGSPRAQHFKLGDVFENEAQLLLDGTLTDWRTGGATDRLSAVFLEPPGSARPDGTEPLKRCRCVCRPRKDSASGLGWAVLVQRITEVGWDEIAAVATIFSGGGEGQDRP